MLGPETANVLAPEVDRQLSDQRAQADAFASRSGLMIAATAVLTGVLAAVLDGGDHLSPSLLWVIGGGAVAGVSVLCMSRIAVGPSTQQLTLWMSQGQPVEVLVLQAKLIAIEANGRALLRTEMMFFLQAAATIAGVGAVVVQLKG